MNRKVKVIVLSSPPAQPYLEFTLIFDDHYEKYYKLDDYVLKQYRGCRELDIIEDQAMQFYEQLGEIPESIELIIF